MNRGLSSRRRFLTAAGAAATVGVAGCTGGGGGTSTIQYLSDRGDSKEVIDEIIAEFEAQSDYTVEVTYTSKGTSTDQQLQKMQAADNPPDIVFDTASDAYRYQRDGNAAQVSDTVQGSGLPDPVNVDGDSYFAATMVEPLLGWYRSDLYDTEPESWATWRSEAARISEETDLHGYTVQSGQTNNADTQMTQYLWQNDVDIYSGTVGDIEVTIDDDANRQAAVETYEWVEQMAQHSPNGSGWEWGDGIGALQQENTAALMSVGGLPVLTIRENRPDLVENLSPTAFPVPEGKSQDQWWAYMEGHVVWSGGDNTEGAREFVDFFSRSERFLDFVLSAPLFQFPPTREGLDSDAVKENEIIQEHQDVMDLIRNNWDAFTTVLATGDDGAANITASNAYGQQLFGQSADQLLVGDRSPEETVDWVAEQLRGLSE
ncbi:MAG: ABC transporter substrate-binding protein [Halolamina sp.]